MKKMICFPAWLIYCWLSGSVYGQITLPGSLIINEILFNPPTGGYDYVELMNIGIDPVRLSGIRIANRNSTGEAAGQKPLTREPLLLQPGGFAVITSNITWVKQHYRTGSEAVLCQVSGMPSFPDDKGIVILLNEENTIIDELSYHKSWQFSLISDPSGVALERIDPAAPTQDRYNWTSASSSSGYGTPGLPNSQFRAFLRLEEEVSITPQIFSPDNDGYNDLLFLRLNPEENNYTANVVIYDMGGRSVCRLLKNETPGIAATYTWDGTDDRGSPLGQGIYVMIIELFQLNGKVKRYKRAVTLVRK